MLRRHPMPQFGSTGRSRISIKAYESFIEEDRRTWKAHLSETGKLPRAVVIKDPQHVDYYLQHDSSLHDPNPDDIRSVVIDDISRREQIRTYCDKLTSSLGLPPLNDETETSDAGDTTRILEIHVSDADRAGSFSIHSLMWELLEHQEYTKHSGISIQIVHCCDAEAYNISGMQSSRVGLGPSQERPFRILLVVSRSYQSNRGHFADLPPTLVSETLSHLSKIVEREGRPFFHRVIRPGTIESFKNELEMAKLSKRPYDLIHFDVHGRIAANGEPQLLFARSYAPTAFENDTQDDTLDFSDAYFHAVGGTQLAELLREHNIPRVALTSCHSSYAQADHVSNLCLILIQHGVEEVTAMNFAIRGTAASLYAQGFYTSLLVGENSFTAASAHGREHVRTRHVKPFRDMEHEPSTLPSVYKRAGDLEQMASEVTRPRRFPLKALLTLWHCFVIAFWVSCHTIPRLKAQWDVIDRTLQWIPFSITLITVLWLIFDVKNFYQSALARRRTWFEVLTDFQQLGTASACSWQGIGMMAVEDMLRSKGSAFLEMGYSPMSAEDSNDFQSAMEEWKKTQSVDVTIVGGEPLASSLWYYSYVLKRKLSTSKQYLKRRVQQLRATITKTSVEELSTVYSLPQRSIIVFTDFSYIFESSTTTKNRERALKRISNIMESTPKTAKLEFLFIGTAVVPWDSGDIDPDLHPWVKGPRLLASRDLCIHEKA